MTAEDTEYKTAEEAERDVDQARQRVSDTLNSLEDKLSPGQLIDKVLPLFRESGASATLEHYGRAIGHSAKANPVPFLLIGAGLTWLAVSATSDRDHRHDADYGYDEWEDDMRSAGTGDMESGETTRHRSAHDMAEAAREKLRTTREDLSNAGHKAMRGIKGAAGRSRDAAAAHPLLLAVAGFAVGSAIGAAMPRTRFEDELFGDYGDQVRQKAREVAEEGIEKVEEAGERVVEAAREAAREEGVTPSAGKETAADLVRRAERVGEAAIDAARAETGINEPDGQGSAEKRTS
jgi:ElaB/YqjD/DUF883 family membrane-anchored ribosome-binding protein